MKTVLGYTVTIKEISSETAVEAGKYCVVGQSYLSIDAYEGLSFKEKQDWKLEEGQYVKNNYGYAPSTSKTSQVETKLFEQTVDNLDIKAVIRAINESPKK